MAEIMEFDPKFSNQAKSFILGILEDEFNLRGIERPDLDDIKSAYQTGKGNFWVAIENGRVIGTIALLDCGDNRGYLKRMYVSREYRGMGLAKDLLDALARFARASGFKEVYCGTAETMAAANKFYREVGKSTVLIEHG